MCLGPGRPCARGAAITAGAGLSWLLATTQITVASALAFIVAEPRRRIRESRIYALAAVIAGTVRITGMSAAGWSRT